MTISITESVITFIQRKSLETFSLVEAGLEGHAGLNSTLDNAIVGLHCTCLLISVDNSQPLWQHAQYLQRIFREGFREGSAATRERTRERESVPRSPCRDISTPSNCIALESIQYSILIKMVKENYITGC